MVSEPCFVQQRRAQRRCDTNIDNVRAAVGEPADPVWPLTAQNDIIVELIVPASVDAVVCEVVIDLDVELLAIGIRVVSNQRFVVENRIAHSARQQPRMDAHSESIAVGVEKVVRHRHCSQGLGEESLIVELRRPLRIPRRPAW